MATILYIDHDVAAQKLVESHLGQQYNVVTATDGPTAIQFCAMIQPDLIVLNLALPDIDSTELTTRLKMFMPQTPLLVMVDPPAASAGQNLPVEGFLTKPVDAVELLRRVQAFVPLPISPSDFTASLLDGSLTEYSLVSRLEAQIAALNQANNRLASLNAVSALIGTSLDLEHLTDEILAQIHKNVDFDSATLFLLKGNYLEAAASRGFSGHRRGMNTYSKSDRNSAWRAVQHKLPLIINDVSESDFWEPRPELKKIRSWLGVPLVYKDRVVGVLTLDKNEPNAFTDADARYVFTLAYQIAIAVENAQLFEEWENQATRLKLINEVSKEINTFLDVDELFDALARAIYERLNYDHVAIFELDETRSALTLKAVCGQTSTRLQREDDRQPLGDGPVGQAIQTGQPVLVNDLAQSSGVPLLEGLEAKSVLVVPLFVGSQVEAVIFVARAAVNGFTDQDLWTLSSLGSQAAIAVKNAWLYRGLDTYSEKLERTIAARTQRLQAIKHISRVVSQGLDIEELLSVVGEGVGQIFNPRSTAAVTVTIGLVNGAVVDFRPIYGPALDSPAAAGSVKIQPDDPLGQVILQGKPKILRNVDPQNMFAAAPGPRPENLVLAAPLITGGKTIGLIMVYSRVPPAFDDSDLELLETLAYQVASAIEHTRLLQKTREIAIVEERTRLARDMHDGIAQNLAYLLIQVDRCLNMAEPGSKLEDRLEQIGLLVEQNIDELRRNIFDLRPVELEGRSLFKALGEFVSEFGRRWNLKTTYAVNGNATEVSPEVESTLYRILQESLSNVQQHARCSRLSVALTVEDDRWITLQVQDDGQGFEVGRAGRQAGSGKGLGLTSMRERVAGVGGQLSVESEPGRGTRIFARLPLATRAKKQ